MAIEWTPEDDERFLKKLEALREEYGYGYDYGKIAEHLEEEGWN